TMNNCTISGNIATRLGGGIYIDIGSTVTVNSSTISGNSAISVGGGIYSDGSLKLTNTIVANSLSGADVSNDPTRTVNNNVIPAGVNLGGLTGTITADPLLGSLQNNGGPTMTMALLSGSSAIDAGDNSSIPAGLTTDQRGSGFARIKNGTVDI